MIERRVDAELGPVKVCPKCHEEWPADSEFFYRSKDGSDGWTSYCRACWSERSIARYWARRERVS